MEAMIIFDFFSGTGSSTKAFKDAGHQVITFELDKDFDATEHVNILDLNAKDLIQRYGQPDFVWASPPCTAFSVASIGHHWIAGGDNPQPRTKQAEENQELVAYTLKLIQDLNPPKGWLLENPRGMLRKLSVVKNFSRRTITYCTYGDIRMKPTDLWGNVSNWIPREPCKNGQGCHTPAPRGSKSGTQGLKNAKERSRIPYTLGQELLIAMIGNK